MKKLSIFSGIVAMLFFASCREVVNSVLDALPPFIVPFNTTLEIPFVSVSTTTYTRTPEIPMNINLDEKIKENNANYSLNNLKSVKLNTLSLEYKNSVLGNKLEVIKNARIYIKAENQPERLIAALLNNTNPNLLNFTLTDEELREYFRTDQNSLIIEIQSSKKTADQITMKMESGFKIKVQL
jgi:hypothetical protein